MISLITVDEKNKNILYKFINSQKQFYVNNEFFVNPVSKEVMDFFNTNNPIWNHTKRQLFIIRENNSDASPIIARGAAFIDDNYIAYSGEKVGYFGFYESVNDTNIAKTLDTAICDWLKGYNIEKVRGPIDASIMGQMGFLISGFDYPPMSSMPFSKQYYPDLMGAIGYEKSKDLHAYSIDINKAKEIILQENSFHKKSDLTDNLKIRKIRKGKGFDEDAKLILDVINDSFKGNDYWQYAPISYEDFTYKVRLLKPIVNPEFIHIATINNKVIGFVFAYPDYNQALRGLNGNVELNHPLNTLKFLWRLYNKKTITQSKLDLICIKTEFERKNIGPLLMATLINNMPGNINTMEYSWVYEHNEASIKLARKFGGELYKVYRIYEKDI